ncbi:hypothetical protein CEUSTIGMA_g10782.t1 [Chlamydomonas eustigma]|uniref:C2 NT-type domain-containing protein n=1 Tax=Chlamydomonas eustigma TaxID=1157962 RepID=A0A250XJV9_9CHLO|nr:hypothetical protein CEUSTIGMA_g10782.t1 [Chlamydomonas eustigma]|eukprot:GAX83357.1 hypothetical protein CEUSTIGMA_g10782.t1 [Chlamydomonas eustigma]
MTIGRSVVNVTQKARGRQPFRYEFEVIPFTAWEVPEGYDKLLFAWERGSKLFVTDAEPVRPNRAVFWKQFLKQQVTMYKSAEGFEKKDFAFKLQSVKINSKGHEDRKTVAKVHIDLAPFCTGQLNPQPVEKSLQLKPFGKLKVSIKACWLKDANIDPETMTELSGTSMFADQQQEEYEEEALQEQDLSGFDRESDPSTSGRSMESIEVDGNETRRKSSRNGRKGKKGRSSRVPRVPDEIPEDDEAPVDPEELRRQQAREERKERRRKQQEHHLHYDAEECDEPPIQIEGGVRIRKTSIKDYLCCCCQPSVQEPRVAIEEDQELLSAQQKANLRRQHHDR